MPVGSERGEGFRLLKRKLAAIKVLGRRACGILQRAGFAAEAQRHEFSILGQALEIGHQVLLPGDAESVGDAILDGSEHEPGAKLHVAPRPALDNGRDERRHAAPWYCTKCGYS